MKKWQLIKTSSDEKTKLWLNHHSKQFSIWRNKGSIVEFKNDTTLEEAEEKFNIFVNMIENDDMTLEDWLIFNNLKLTTLEVEVLNYIRSQGSFYEEAAYYDEDAKQYYVKNRSCFFGWQITEEEVPGCRGALSSLVKKGVLEIVFDDTCKSDEFPQGMQAYYIKFTLRFDEHDRIALSGVVLAND